MPMTYSQLQDVKARIVRDLAAQQAALEQAKSAFAVVSGRLTQMQLTYAEWATEVNDWLTANPADAAALALKAERDELVSEFAAAKAEADALDTAVNA